MTSEGTFRVLIVDLTARRGEVVRFGSRLESGGGSGLAAALYESYGLPEEAADHPQQPLIFAIGPLTGYFPLMSKVVCGFKSPYHDQYTESHAGGRLALAIRFAGYDAILLRGKAATPSCAVIGSRGLQVDDVHYLWGINSLMTGMLLRRVYPQHSGCRRILRIGPAGENGFTFACINVDTFRHFGRMGAGCVMGAKNVKAITVHGDGDISLPGGKAYAQLFQEVHEKLTDTEMMRKYYDLGTAANLTVLNERSSLPWRNMQQTADPAVDGISGERFGDELLMRQAACAGCPVGCIHLGMLRVRFADAHQFEYRQVSYDYEPIFAAGSMLGITVAGDVLSLLEEVERVGLDVMSTGVALAWATEALEKGLVTEEQTRTPLAFGQVDGYRAAIRHLARAENDFYRLLGRGTLAAAREYGGEEFACVLGQEMAGYATGEVYFTAQSLGFRHSHLDTGGYTYDQLNQKQDVDEAIRFLVDDERGRCLLTSMVSCLFARGVYSSELLSSALASIGQEALAADVDGLGERVQRARWRLRFKTGFDPSTYDVPRRLRKITTWKGALDEAYLDKLRESYAREITALGKPG